MNTHSFKFISIPYSDFRKVHGLFKLNDPIYFHDGFSHNLTSTNYIIVSESNTHSGPETFIFPADRDGEILDYTQLPGSITGELNAYKALTNRKKAA